MAKDYFEDVSPSRGNRSIRNIPTSSRPHTSRTSRTSNGGGPTSRSHHPFGGKFIIWLVAVIAVAGLGVLAFTLLGETSVTVTPRQHTVVFDETAVYEAQPQGGSGLTYQTVTRTYEDSTTVQATGSEEVEDRASGTITVYNDFSEESQRLIANTRFETPSGLVYRVQNAVVVPGKTDAGPGTLEVTVYADEPGEAYNIGPVSRFTLPGLTTEPDMFESIYARSMESMTGGFVGVRPVVNESVLASARAEMRDRLAARIEADDFSSIENGYAVPSLAEISYEAPAPEQGADGSVVVRERARVLIPVFDEAAFAASIAAETSAAADDDNTTIADASSFTITAAAGSGEPELGTDPIEFSLEGTATFVGTVDTEQLSQDLAGKDREAFERIVGAYPGIETATANLAPFWRSTFPSDPGAIRIDVEASDLQG